MKCKYTAKYTMFLPYKFAHSSQIFPDVDPITIVINQILNMVSDLNWTKNESANKLPKMDAIGK